MNHVHNLGNEDEDSLFGSPPSSPARGRSPPLALPSGIGTQNVGTIALPGSHIYSELPVNTLASSWSFPELAPRPPAQPTHISVPADQPAQPSQPSSRASSVSAKKTKVKQKDSTPRSLPPPIPLPDPDTRPPANFLRNQQALLGMAGLVGGVNPATLSVRHTHGSTRKNPIIVDDEYNPPPLGCSSRLPPPVDPALLPTPSQEQVIESLVRQKDIFPVLESLLKLLAAGESQGTTSSRTTPECRNGSEEPPMKKRKLASVPAGAGDWDIPYPFSMGEGPNEYRTNWERERCKQLIAQLVGSLKSAARKAATKKYLRQRKYQKDGSTPPAQLNPYRHHWQATATYEPGCLQHIPDTLADSNDGDTPRPSLCDSDLDLTSSVQPSTTFDQLLASLFSGSRVNPPSSEVTSDSTTPEIDPGFFQNWMSLLESVPPPEGQCEGGVEQAVASTNSSCIFPFDMEIPSVVDHSSLPTQTDTPSPDVMDCGEHSPSPEIALPDFAIDPALLAISIPPYGQSQSSAPHFGINPPTPALSQSPLQSASSLADPLTPIWDVPLAEPDIFAGDQGEHSLTGASGLLQLARDSSALGQPSASTSTSKPFNTATPPQEHALTTDQPLSIITSTPTSSLTTSTIAIPALPRATARSRKSATEKPVREDILRKARERRRQLVAGIDRTKVELWETTIEQGVLAHLAKEK